MSLSSRPPGLSTQSRDAYEAIASSYDILTDDYQHDLWLARLEQLAFQYGLNGNRLLDLACGTGKSFLPLLERGYRVTACDISPAMLAVARRKAPSVVLHEADIRDLPRFGDFDLITALDDPLNYLLAEEELRAALAGMGRNLARRGLAVFDLNTLAQYRGQFARDATMDGPSSFIAWRGRRGNLEALDGSVVEATVEVFRAAEENRWQRTSSLHRQRHWPRAVVERLVDEAQLELLAVLGQRSGAHIDDDLEELVHIKAIYVVQNGREAS